MHRGEPPGPAPCMSTPARAGERRRKELAAPAGVQRRDARRHAPARLCPAAAAVAKAVDAARPAPADAGVRDRRGRPLGAGGWRRTRILYLQRQCLRYEAPPDQVVYDQCPDTASGLIARGGEHFSAYPRPWMQFKAAAHEPRPLTELRQLTPTVPTLARTGAVLFMHERRTPSGVSRLVLVRSEELGIVPEPALSPDSTWG